MSDHVEAKHTQASDARQALVSAALEAFAESGINGVSLRQITARAGQLNQSAVSYHCGNKDGLVAAVLALVTSQLSAGQKTSLERLGQRASDEWTSLELTEMMCAPFVDLYLSGPLGLASIRFLSRLTWQEGGHGQALLVGAVQPYFSCFAPAFLALNAGKSLQSMSLKIYLAVNTLIHGLADVTLLGTQPVQGLDTMSEQKAAEMVQVFYSYMAGGLVG